MKPEIFLLLEMGIEPKPIADFCNVTVANIYYYQRKLAEAKIKVQEFQIKVQEVLKAQAVKKAEAGG